jgi:hypothetical protein
VWKTLSTDPRRSQVFNKWQDYDIANKGGDDVILVIFKICVCGVGCMYV